MQHQHRRQIVRKWIQGTVELFWRRGRARVALEHYLLRGSSLNNDEIDSTFVKSMKHEMKSSRYMFRT